MNSGCSSTLVFALVGLIAAGVASPAPARADGVQVNTAEVASPATPKPAKSKAQAHKRQTKLDKAKPSEAQKYDAPLQLDFDPMKRVILKAEPSVPYQPQIASRLPPTQGSDDTGKPHLAPLLREDSTPESFGDRGSFIDRHEFGIQLHDHF
jgi:hypothetical protein